MIAGDRQTARKTPRGTARRGLQGRRSRVRHVLIAAAMAGASAVATPVLADMPPPTHALTLREPLEPVPEAPAGNADLVTLGRALFFDTRLSGSGRASCATCHDPAKGGTDGTPVSIGPGAVPRLFNTPTLFNAGFAARFGWRGHEETLEAAVSNAVPAELGGDWAAVTARLSADAALAGAFPGGVTRRDVETALTAYVRALVTPDAPFDRWLKGEADALTPQQQRGYALFKSYGCASCHQGRAAGGTMFQPIGLFKPFFPRHGTNARADLGRYGVTGREADRHSFKVPSLRNVARTAPYLHDGSVATLSGVVRLMAYYQVGRSLSDQDVADIVAFLESLTAPLPTLALPPEPKKGAAS